MSPAAELYVARVPAVVLCPIIVDLFTNFYAPTISRIAVDIAQDFSQARILIVLDPRRKWWKKPGLHGRAAFGGHRDGRRGNQRKHDRCRRQHDHGAKAHAFNPLAYEQAGACIPTRRNDTHGLTPAGPQGSRSERRNRRKRSAVRGHRQGRARLRLPRRSLSPALRDTLLVRLSAGRSGDALASLSVALLETALRPAAALGCHRRQRKLHRHENGKCSERVSGHVKLQFGTERTK